MKVDCSRMMIFIVAVVIALLKTASSTWWFMSQMQMSAVGGTSPALCDLIPGLSRRQRRICQLHPDVMTAVAAGARRGVSECQFQFSQYRWNCTTIDGIGFGRIMLKLGSREAAFVYAISTASVVHSIARSCSNGQVSDCGCDTRRIGRDQDANGEFLWGGCADNVHYATTFARRFIDSKDRKSRDGRALMNLHNNRAGRKAVKRNVIKQCKCHGVSGSCTTRTCWEAIPNFRMIGDDLRHKYDRAMRVIVNPDGAALTSADDRRFDSVSGWRRPYKRHAVNKMDLVYFEPSPDYCDNDIRTGSLGTAGRECNVTSSGPDSCDVMCCGRGYDTVSYMRTFKCHCKFVWCCRVDCLTCTELVNKHTCKHPAGFAPNNSMPLTMQRYGKRLP